MDSITPSSPTRFLGNIGPWFFHWNWAKNGPWVITHATEQARERRTSIYIGVTKVQNEYLDGSMATGYRITLGPLVVGMTR